MKRAGTLVIVESPSKAKTIHKYLGKNYTVRSSVGHIIDLPKSRLAVDIERNFKPEYITIRGKAKILGDLKKEAARAVNVLLATDPDREGEAISWHLSNALSSKNENIRRIEFNEITQDAVREAIKNPRAINMDLVNAQQARRILDRIVGYNISPILWKKVKKGLSAGRVQSVALKVICDREAEIDSFEPEEYWTLDVSLKCGKGKFTASLHSYQDEKIKLKSREDVDAVIQHLEGREFTVKEVKKQERKRKPIAPFITSKLQQDAAIRLGYTSRKTMIIAQQLYEGVNISGEGPTGLITYMRTDSIRVSGPAITAVRTYIAEKFSSDFLPEKTNFYANKKGAQDAHEAIRPTDVFRTPESIKGDITAEQYKIYDLIWRRFVSSQMTPEQSEVTSADITAGDCLFHASGSRLLFPGFTEVEKYGKQEKNRLPELKQGDACDRVKTLPEQHFTAPPPRYNDASLVKFLEDSGIGRPSTYAPTIETLLKRYYVTRSARQLVPTVLGKIVNGIMAKYFATLVSIDFTANMEDKLDLIEESRADWVGMLSEFYPSFKDTIDHAVDKIDEMKGILDEPTDIKCENCGRNMVKKLGRFGFFLACPGFPECRNAKPIPMGKCPKCGEGDIVKRAARKRNSSFFSCTRYPECDFIARENPAEKPCPKCGRALFKKKVKGMGEKLICLNDACAHEISLPDSENGTTA